MKTSSHAQELIDAALALARDDGPGFVAAFRAHDWRAVACKAARAELTLAAAAGVPGAAAALLLLPLAVELAARPADPADPAMAKAAGPGGDVWGGKTMAPPPAGQP